MSITIILLYVAGGALALHASRRPKEQVFDPAVARRVIDSTRMPDEDRVIEVDYVEDEGLRRRWLQDV